MSVLAVYNTEITDDYCTVTALVEDAMLVYQPTGQAAFYHPAEYGPGVCEAGFEMDPGESIPVDEADFCSYLDSLDLDWRLVEDDDSYLDD
jgi:hypothetical protein